MLLSLPFGVPASAALDLLGGLVCVALDCTPFGLGNGVSCVAASLPKASSARALMIPSASIGLCTLNDTDLLVKTVRGPTRPLHALWPRQSVPKMRSDNQILTKPLLVRCYGYTHCQQK